LNILKSEIKTAKLLLKSCLWVYGRGLGGDFAWWCPRSKYL